MYETSYLRRQVLKRLARINIHPTPQALSALLETMLRTPSEIAGDSDSLLLGLLYSGSYTVDVLECAGVDPRRILHLANESVAGWWDEGNPVETLLSHGSPALSALKRAGAAGGVLETAHILETALDPTPTPSFRNIRFPLQQRRDSPARTSLLRQIEQGICELIAYATTIVEVKNTHRALRSRSQPLSNKERYTIRRELRDYHREISDDELNLLLAVMNDWFVHKIIRSEPASLVLKLINTCAGLPYAPGLLIEVGGDLKTVDSLLQMTSRLSPERDLAGLALFERDGRLIVGQYTYRNTFSIEPSTAEGHIPQRLSVQAVRPVSLVPSSILSKFEDIISLASPAERQIQAFLGQHPELLEAIGYVSARPHLCLYDEDNSDLIPDFILELPGERGFDILDLKLPTARIVSRHPYPRVSGEIVKAIAQLRKYRSFFDKAENRRSFQRKYGLEAFRPELVVVIGRSLDFHSRSERIEIEEQMRDVKLLTYDDLIAYGKSRQIVVPKLIIQP